jgi:cell division protein FtsW
LQRMMSFLSPGEDLAEASWQINQSLIGFGSGRLFGLGFGQGLQKLGYLPYAYSDFIFSTIGEEWGFVGVTLIVLLYAVFIIVGLRIARAARDSFGMLLATGLTALIGLTALLHMAVTISLVPATGLSLPFVSYGRSNLLVSLFAVGVLINIGSHSARRRARS